MNVEFAEMKGQLTAIETRLTKIENRLFALESRMTHVETRIGNVETQMIQLVRFEQIERRLKALEESAPDQQNL